MSRASALSITLEHHSNVVPWQVLCQEEGAALQVGAHAAVPRGRGHRRKSRTAGQDAGEGASSRRSVGRMRISTARTTKGSTSSPRAVTRPSIPVISSL